MQFHPRRALRLVPVAVTCCCLCSTTVKADERSASYLAALESIGAAELRRHVEFLADDELLDPLTGQIVSMDELDMPE